jgi:hypothetical protein
MMLLEVEMKLNYRVGSRLNATANQTKKHGQWCPYTLASPAGVLPGLQDMGLTAVQPKRNKCD